MLTQSDLVFTTGRIFAEQIAQAFPLVFLEAPRELGQMQFYMLWHECKHQSPDHVWRDSIFWHGYSDVAIEPEFDQPPVDRAEM
ncbi:hypothetical protein ACC695_38800, partial [Rhizobium ruizarguesonis]